MFGAEVEAQHCSKMPLILCADKVTYFFIRKIVVGVLCWNFRTIYGG
jgi:hypothetical protein